MAYNGPYLQNTLYTYIKLEPSKVIFPQHHMKQLIKISYHIFINYFELGCLAGTKAIKKSSKAPNL